jgi:serine/threonine protein kinase
LYDDFVIIERQKERQTMEQLKIVEEEQIKNQSATQLLIARNTLSPDEQNYALEDFKIRKVIDKGSFGKVYLVVNRKNGKLYAMKRINKDILIDKKQI